MAEQALDAMGMVLPLALVRLKQALDRAAVGDTVCFGCDVKDVSGALERYLDRTGHEICSRETKEGYETLIIRKR